ncbi:MAG: nucleotidyltransferase [Thermoanaerobaculia bacterium]
MATDFQRLIDALAENQVDFVVIGAVALVLHGSARVTQDLDICYARNLENLERLAAALEPFHPSLRGAPPGLPFRLDARTLQAGLNFTLVCDAGDFDILGDVQGVGDYVQVAKDAVPMEVYGHRVLVMSLSALQKAKRSAGRLKDLPDLDEIDKLLRGP